MVGKHVKFYVLFFALLTLSKVMAAGYPQARAQDIYSKQLVKLFAQEMKKEFELICIGDGGCMAYDIQEMDVAFITYKKGTVEEARELEVRVTEKFVEAINAHEKIRPYLREYPFKRDRAKVSISFNREDNNSYSDGSVIYVSQVNNRIFYDAIDPISKKRFILREELFEDAVKTVKNTPAMLKKKEPNRSTQI